MQTEMMNQGEKPEMRVRTPQKRYNGFQVEEAIELLRQASLMVAPENLSLRKVVSQMLPQIHLLYTQGFSYKQIAGFMSDMKIHIELGTLKTYYNMFLAEITENSAERFNAQAQVLNAIRKENQELQETLLKETGASKRQAISSKISENANRALSSYTAKYINEKNIPEIKSPESSTPSKAESEIKSATVPQPVKRIGEQARESEPANQFGLLEQTAETTKSDGLGTFNSIFPEDPVIPKLGENEDQKQQAVNWKIKSLKPDIKPYPRREGVPEIVYDPELVLEHPAIPGLFLNIHQRLYGAALELIDENGNERMESLREEQTFRIRWKSPIPATEGRTSSNFTEMNMTLFGGNKN